MESLKDRLAVGHGSRCASTAAFVERVRSSSRAPRASIGEGRGERANGRAGAARSIVFSRWGVMLAARGSFTVGRAMNVRSVGRRGTAARSVTRAAVGLAV